MKNLSKFISVTHRRTQIFYTEQFKKVDINSGQFMYIVCICEKVGQTQDELAQNLIIDKSTVAKVLSQLEVTGYIQRKLNLKDRRVFNIFPTDKATAIYPEIVKIKEKWHDYLTEDLTNIERDLFEKLMEKVMKNAIKNCRK